MTVPTRWIGLMALFFAAAIVLVGDSTGQDVRSPLPGLPPEPWPPASRYYEARITPEGYSIYVPFFIPRDARFGERPRPGSESLHRADAPSSATVAVRSSFDVRSREEIIPGEFVQVYRPAVYELDEQGRERLIEPEQTVTLPKIRLILERIPVSEYEKAKGIAAPGDGAAAHLPSAVDSRTSESAIAPSESKPR